MSFSSQSPVVLAATDLSLSADGALRHGDTQAAARGRPLVVCHVISEQMDAKSIAETVAARVRDVTRRPNSSSAFEVVVSVGDPGNAIVELARSRDAELITVGSSGDARGLQRVLGTTAERIVRLAPCSVLVIRQRRGLQVLVATDLSEASTPAITAGACEAKRRDVPLTIVHCIDPLDETMRGDRIEDAREKILAAVARCGIEAEVCIVVGIATETILRAIDGVGADLVVVATSGRTGLERMVLGSTAEAVVRRAPCTVLVVRSDRR